MFRIVVLAALCIPAFTQQAQGPLTNARIGDLMLAGVSQAEIVRIIGSAPAVNFDLRPNSTDELLKVGVSEDIIKAMAAREMGTAPPQSRPSATAAPATVAAPQANSKDEGKRELRSIRTVFVAGNSEAANALRDKVEIYTCLRGSINQANSDAVITVDEASRRSYSVLTGDDNKVSASVVVTMPNGDQVWAKNKLGGDGFIHSGAGLASVQILRALAKDACPGWSLRNEGKPGARFHKDYQRSD